MTHPQHWSQIDWVGRLRLWAETPVLLSSATLMELHAYVAQLKYDLEMAHGPSGPPQDQSNKEVDEALAKDRLLYGDSFEKRSLDGTRERLDPRNVTWRTK